MTLLRTFTPHNGLNDCLDDWRGLDCATAVRSADALINRMRPGTLTAIANSLGALREARNRYRGSKGAIAFDIGAVYAEADAIAGLGRRVGRPSLGQAAAGLCRLATNNLGAHPEAVAVHIEALMMIWKDEKAGDILAPELSRLSALGET